MASKFRRGCYRAHWRTAASWLCARAIRDDWDKAEQPSRPRPSYWQAGEQSPSSCVAKPGTSGRARAPGRGQLDLESEQRGFVAHRGRRTMGMAYLQVRTERPHHDEDHSRRTPSQVLRVREATGASMRRHDYAAAARATGEPQLAGYAHTHAVNYDGNATEHANAGSSSGEWPIVATEHDDGPDILFTIDDASERRRSFRGQPGRLHSEARKRLNAVTEIAAQDDADEVYCIGDTFCWKDYIAWHDDCNEIIGTGIIAAHLEKYAAQQIIIEQTMPELITCSTDPTTRIAECIPAPNAKTMHN